MFLKKCVFVLALVALVAAKEPRRRRRRIGAEEF